MAVTLVHENALSRPQVDRLSCARTYSCLREAPLQVRHRLPDRRRGALALSAPPLACTPGMLADGKVIPTAVNGVDALVVAVQAHLHATDANVPKLYGLIDRAADKLPMPGIAMKTRTSADVS